MYEARQNKERVSRKIVNLERKAVQKRQFGDFYRYIKKRNGFVINNVTQRTAADINKEKWSQLVGSQIPISFKAICLFLQKNPGNPIIKEIVKEWNENQTPQYIINDGSEYHTDYKVPAENQTPTEKAINDNSNIDIRHDIAFIGSDKEDQPKKHKLPDNIMAPIIWNTWSSDYKPMHLAAYLRDIQQSYSENGYDKETELSINNINFLDHIIKNRMVVVILHPNPQYGTTCNEIRYLIKNGYKSYTSQKILTHKDFNKKELNEIDKQMIANSLKGVDNLVSEYTKSKRK